MRTDIRPSAIVIGASAGGVEALVSLLPRLSAPFPPVVVVVHLPAGRPSLLPEIFSARCAHPCIEAGDHEPLLPSHVYFAPADYHLLVNDEHTLCLSNEEPVLFSRPSIDVLFESAADVFGKRLIGIILTGANEDGSKGAARIASAGGCVIVQSPQSASVPTMPEAAIALCPEADVMTLDDIPAFITKIAALS